MYLSIMLVCKKNCDEIFIIGILKCIAHLSILQSESLNTHNQHHGYQVLGDGRWISGCVNLF